MQNDHRAFFQAAWDLGDVRVALPDLDRETPGAAIPNREHRPFRTLPEQGRQGDALDVVTVPCRDGKVMITANVV